MRLDIAFFALVLTLGAQPAAQTIQITSVPAYGTPGFLTGIVSGVNFSTHSVTIYIYVEGSGWWTKPTAANPTVPIQPNGTFTANVVTGGLDDRATLYCAALLGPTIMPPVALGSCRIPASLQSLAVHYLERFGRKIQFAGRTWAIKESPLVVGPGRNVFSDNPADVWVDSQGLHLRVSYRSGQWWATEVILLDDVGYGTYWFTTESQVGSLDPNLTFGAFTWDSFCDDPAVPLWPNRELDFEDSRWGNALDPTTSQVVVQPAIPVRYSTPFLGPPPTLTRALTWTQAKVQFTVAIGRHSPCSSPTSSVLHKSTHTSPGTLIPSAGRQRFRFNLWINTGSAPASNQPAEVIISDFRFTPYAGVFQGGCGINPAGSIRVLSGSTSIGAGIVIGVDNPAGTQRPASTALLVVAARPDARFPCGTSLPGFGMTGASGELLVDLSSPHVALIGGAWTGSGNPVPFAVPIPLNASLVGMPVYAQGAIVDTASAATRVIGLADALELCFQS